MINTTRNQYERVFSDFDENKDGRISPLELQQRILTMTGGAISLAEAEEAVMSMDADGDGELGFEDFLRFVEGGGEEEKENELREAFKMYEDHMDGGDGLGGCITPRSLKRMLSRLGQPRSHDECKVMIAHFDLDEDGVLNFDEFKVMML